MKKYMIFLNILTMLLFIHACGSDDSTGSVDPTDNLTIPEKCDLQADRIEDKGVECGEPPQEINWDDCLTSTDLEAATCIADCFEEFSCEEILSGNTDEDSFLVCAANCAP